MNEQPIELTGFRSMMKRFLAPKRAIMQAIGFLVGLALVAWVVKGAIDVASDPTRAGILESVRAAWNERPWLVLGIALTTTVSLIIDGALFWMVLVPVRRLGFMEIQWLTFVTATSNFFPVRLGIPVRYAYALLANRLTFMQATAWFIAVTLVVLVSLGAVIAATALIPIPGLGWAGLVLVALAIGGFLLQRVAHLPIAARRFGEWTRMLTTPSTYWAGTVLRVIEVLLWIVRMWCAAEILNLGLSFATVTVLGVAAIAVMLNPFGRIGFREATTVLVANWMAGGGIDVSHADGGFKQLALLESLGEMFTTIPLGLISLPFVISWYRMRRRELAVKPN
ncbi:MAG: hypothetical protein WCO75_00745 [Planctomycetota bacterium]